MGKDKIENRRLYAFLRSQTLTILMLMAFSCLFLMQYLNDLIIPSFIGGVIFCMAIGYSLLFWIKKPNKIVINNWLSNISSVFLLYWFIVNAMECPNKILYIIPIICLVALFVVVLMNQRGFEFKI
ncbi:MAG: hypothetical protein J1F38_07285 [Muribaculaceae bacterium]|nr:hypothetical protein [Muribaculaceae bacterium]